MTHQVLEEYNTKHKQGDTKLLGNYLTTTY